MFIIIFAISFLATTNTIDKLDAAEKYEKTRISNFIQENHCVLMSFTQKSAIPLGWPDE